MAASPIFMEPSLYGSVSSPSQHYGIRHREDGDEDNYFFSMQEDDTCFLLSLEMPGVQGNDLEVSLVDTTLTIGGYRRSSVDSRKRQRIRRTLEIDPDAIHVDRAIARVWNGSLTLYAPKKKTQQQESVKSDSSATSSSSSSMISDRHF